MREGWKCPNCGKAHGPHIATCPEPAAPELPEQAVPPYVIISPHVIPAPADWWAPQTAPAWWQTPVIGSGAIVAVSTGISIN